MNDTWILVRADGAAQGNPGPGGIGYLIEEENGQILASGSAFIGETTNNVAEYRALIAALKRARELGFRRVRVLSDSLLVVQQVNGKWRVRDKSLEPLYAEVSALLAAFEERSVEHVPREENQEADQLAAEAIAQARAR